VCKCDISEAKRPGLTSHLSSYGEACRLSEVGQREVCSCLSHTHYSNIVCDAISDRFPVPGCTELLTAAGNISRRVWAEIRYHLNVCRATTGANVEIWLQMLLE
jgi:hypothetical protein